MKFTIETEVDVEPVEIRKMLERGYVAHKAALDAENLRHSRTRDNVAYMLDPNRTEIEDERHKQATAKLSREGDLWKQILISFTRVEP